MNIVNIAAYRFVSLDDLPRLRTELKGRCLSLQLKGTVLLAPEGINLFLAGGADSVATFIAGMNADARFCGMGYKHSTSAEQPFNRMLVKLKKEIISMGVPAINPAEQPAPALAARTLKAWLDAGRDVVLLDTRNQYEIRLGSFRTATHLDIDTFRSFPDAAAQLDESLKDRTVVTFCTGGIRCEKAAPLLKAYGFKRVFQLEGGILKYFEEVGDAHFNGECFVFDRRVALNGRLEDAGTVQCFNCLSPVSLEEQRSAAYVADVSCPHCAKGKPVKRLAA
jgi:UPF0176 protein